MKIRKKILFAFLALAMLISLPHNVEANNKGEIEKDFYIPAAIPVRVVRTYKTSEIPKKIYVQKVDDYGNLYGGWLDKPKTLARFSTGHSRVEYSGSIDLIGRWNDR